MSFMPRSEARTNLRIMSGFCLMMSSEAAMPCAICGKKSSVGITRTFTPAPVNRRDPVRHAGHADRLAFGDELPHAGRPDRLDVDVVLGQPRAREQAEQRVERRVLVRHHGDGLALQVGRLGDAAVLAHHELHEALAAEHRDDLHRHAVAAHHDRPVGDDAAERRVAGADLLGHVNAAAPDRERHVEAGVLVVALAERQPDGPERRQHRRRGKQIGDLLERRLRPCRRGQQAEAGRGAASSSAGGGISSC